MSLSAVICSALSGWAEVDFGGDLAALAGEKCAEILDHVGCREQTAVAGDQAAGSWRSSPDICAFQHGGERRWPGPRQRTPGCAPAVANPRWPSSRPGTA